MANDKLYPCSAALGCVLEDGHAGPHRFDLTESARLGAEAILERLKDDPTIAQAFRLQLAGEPAAVVLRRLGGQLDEAAEILRGIARDLAAGVALWDCDCQVGIANTRGVCSMCGGKVRTTKAQS